jgi:hypothetical protein
MQLPDIPSRGSLLWGSSSGSEATTLRLQALTRCLAALLNAVQNELSHRVNGPMANELQFLPAGKAPQHNALLPIKQLRTLMHELESFLLGTADSHI